MISIANLPALNATLNATAALLLLAGFVFIRRRQIQAHRFCMLSAFGVSILFLIFYLIYHYHVGDVRFQGTGWIRPVYFTMLISHIALALVVVPLAIVTLRRGLASRFDPHRRIARWTWPIWMYVSVTGVLVYVMVYHIYAVKPLVAALR